LKSFLKRILTDEHIVDCYSMTKLFITRHGQTEWNREGKLQGWKDSPLTEKGIEQARALRERLGEEDLDVAYISPSGRTVKTAEMILDGRDVKTIEDERIKEINMGEWEGTRSDEIKNRFPKVYSDFWERPNHYEPISGESFYELKERISSFLEEVLEKHRGENVLIVSHGGASKIILSLFEGRDLKYLWEPPKLRGGCLSLVEVEEEEEESEIILFGDTSFREE